MTQVVFIFQLFPATQELFFVNYYSFFPNKLLFWNQAFFTFLLLSPIIIAVMFIQDT